jgi:hypothetical protein
VKMRKRNDDSVLLMGDGAEVSSQLSEPRAGIDDGDAVRISEHDLQTGGVPAELLKTRIASIKPDDCRL